MASSFRVYIDESGDEGFSFRAGSSEWFVLSAVMIATATELATVKLVDNVRTLLNKPEKKPLHFRDLKHHHRVPYVTQIAGADLRVATVLVHKPSLHEPEVFQQRFRLYFYAVRYLLERVSWYCRDNRGRVGGDGTAEIFFSNRSGMSYSELRDYLELLKQRTDVTIDWTAIRPTLVQALSSGRAMGLQIADAVASSFFYAVEINNYGNTEDRYAAILKPVVYSYSSRYLGYGVKLWPKEVAQRVSTDMVLEWVRRHYLI